MLRINARNLSPFLLLFWIGFFIHAWPLSAESRLEAEARKEKGRIVWYTSLNITTSKPIVDRFQKKYPFMKVSLYRASAERILNRVMTEERAGSSRFDVVSSQAVFYFKHVGLLSQYRSPEAKAYLKEFYDPEGYWVMFFANQFAIGYNTKLVPKEHAPKDWWDLLHPRWRGKIGMDAEEFLWYGGMLKYMGEEKGLKLMKKLAQQDIHWRRGHTLIAQIMAVGEFSVAIIYTHRIDDMRSKGAPVEWVRTADPIPLGVSGMGISAKTKAPASSRLFMDFALSPEAQSVIVKSGRNSGRKEMQRGKKGLKIVPIPPEVLRNVNRYAKEFNEIFHSSK
ncbi:MAG: extracellular solute-binding protein [Deltaproteobacteria bacterium]|nr:extracellular solute-binding protein [Deltaproteobacteria bacterium]